MTTEFQNQNWQTNLTDALYFRFKTKLSVNLGLELFSSFNVMGELTVTNLFESHTIFADHKDLIHDVAYDFYGERMATCSSDQYVKVVLLKVVINVSNIIYNVTVKICQAVVRIFNVYFSNLCYVSRLYIIVPISWYSCPYLQYINTVCR